MAPKKKNLLNVRPLTALEAPAFADYGKGDPWCFRFLTDFAKNFELTSSDDTKLVWRSIPSIMNLFLVLDTRFLSAKSPASVIPGGQATLIKFVLQNVAKNNFSFGQ